MSVRLNLKGFDDIISAMPGEPFCVNDYDGTDIRVKEYIDSKLLTNLVNEDLTLTPSCQCGELNGYQYLGQICSNQGCGTLVSSILDEEIDFRVWVRQPERVSRLIQPWFLFILLNRYKITKPSIQLVEYLITTNLRYKEHNLTNIDQLRKLDYMLEQRGIKRGYNSFVDNFDEIIEILEFNFCNVGRQQDKANFVAWARSKKDECVLNGYVPILNKSLFVLDSSDGVRYMNRDMTEVVNAVRRMTGIDIRGLSDANVQNRTAKFLVDLANFYKDYFNNKLFTKQALIRQNIIRARSHFTLRAVVTSRTDIHQPEELLIPWSAATSVFEIHIMSGLMARNFSYKDAQDHLNAHVNVYSPIIDEIFKEIIDGTKYGKPYVDGDLVGLPTATNRNPSLGRSSYISTLISGVKTNPRDKTVSISFQHSPNTNMDFDGDMLMFTLMWTQKQKEGLKPFESHNNILGLRSPNGFTNSIGFPKSIIGTVSHWVYLENLD